MLVPLCPFCWKGEGYRKYLREMEEERIFERRLVLLLGNALVLASLTNDNLSPFYRLQGRVQDTSRKIFTLFKGEFYTLLPTT